MKSIRPFKQISFLLTLCVTLLCGVSQLYAQDMLIAGVVDGPLSGGTKGIELYVLNDIGNLSQYGIGSANNGGGSDGEEFTFPAVSATAGDCILITQDQTNFQSFFGFPADYEAGAASINGDDAIELFFNGNVIDVFGDITYSGDPAWDFVDGWIYRIDGTGPDGTVYNPNNWTTSGIDALDNETSNSTATFPYPICTYQDVMSTTPEFNFSVPALTVSESDGTANVTVNLSLDADCTVQVGLLSGSSATEGMDFFFTSPTLLDFTASSTLSVNFNIQIEDDAEFEGDESFTLELQNPQGSGACAIGNTDQLLVTITDNEFAQVDIGSLAADDPNGISLFLGDKVEVTGIVNCLDFRGGAGYEFYMSDNTGGINIFSFSDVDGYSVTEGDEITVRGEVLQFRGLTEIEPDQIILNSQGNAVIPPIDAATATEATESQLIRLLGVSLANPADWTTGQGGFGFEVIVTDGVNNTLVLIDSDTELYNLSPPAGTFNLTGISSQRASSTSAPFLDGYRILPCSAADFDPVTNVNDPVADNAVQVFPNPVRGLLNVQTGNFTVQELRIINLLGQVELFLEAPGIDFSINTEKLNSGIYFLELTGNEATVVKEILVD